MHPTPFDQMKCSLARSLAMIGAWWSPLILRDLFYGARRFEELAEDLGLPRATLTSRLKDLVESGVVSFTPDHDAVRRGEYELTECGRDLVPVLMALQAWGDRWADPAGKPPVVFRHQDCQQFFRPTVCCPQCDQPVTMESTDVIAGPGAGIGPGTMRNRALITQPQEERQEGAARARRPTPARIPLR